MPNRWGEEIIRILLMQSVFTGADAKLETEYGFKQSSTGNSTQHSLMTDMGKESKNE